MLPTEDEIMLLLMSSAMVAKYGPNALTSFKTELFEESDNSALPLGLVYLKMKPISYSDFIGMLKEQMPDEDIDSLLPILKLKNLCEKIMEAFYQTPEESIDMMKLLCQCDPFAFAFASEMCDILPFPSQLKSKYFVALFRAYFTCTTNALADQLFRISRLELITEYLNASYALETEFYFPRMYKQVKASIWYSVRFRKMYGEGEWFYGFIFVEPNPFNPPSYQEPITQYTYVQCAYDMIGRAMPPNSELLHFCDRLNVSISESISDEKQKRIDEMMVNIVTNNEVYFWTDSIA